MGSFGSVEGTTGSITAPTNGWMCNLNPRTGRPRGPRRAASVESYLRQTRFIALLALVAFVAGVVSDFTSGNFWGRHALLASLAGSVLVVMLSLAVINEVLERGRRRRWSILAQYVMFELVRNA